MSREGSRSCWSAASGDLAVIRPRDNHALQRTGRAERSLVIPRRRSARPAVECWSVMRRKIFTWLTFTCVLASAGMIALLARSYSTNDGVQYTFGSSDRAVFRSFDLGSLEGSAMGRGR